MDLDLDLDLSFFGRVDLDLDLDLNIAGFGFENFKSTNPPLKIILTKLKLQSVMNMVVAHGHNTWFTVCWHLTPLIGPDSEASL